MASVGVVKEYDDKGRLIAEFFQNNGIKEGEYKSYDYCFIDKNEISSVTISNYINGYKNGYEITYWKENYNDVRDISLYDNDNKILTINFKWDNDYYTNDYELSIEIDHNLKNYSKIHCINNVINVLEKLKSSLV